MFLLYLSKAALAEDHEEVEVAGPDHVLLAHVVRHLLRQLSRLPLVVLKMVLLKTQQGTTTISHLHPQHKQYAIHSS